MKKGVKKGSKRGQKHPILGPFWDPFLSPLSGGPEEPTAQKPVDGLSGTKGQKGGPRKGPKRGQKGVKMAKNGPFWDPFLSLPEAPSRHLSTNSEKVGVKK